MSSQYQRLDGPEAFECGDYRSGPVAGGPLQDVCAGGGVVVVGGPPPYDISPLAEEAMSRRCVDSRKTSDISDYLAWSLCSMMHFNVCCLGFVATVFSIKSRDRKFVNDLGGARRYGKISMTLNIIALVLGLVALGLFIFAVCIVASRLLEYEHSIHDGNHPFAIDDGNNLLG